MTDRQEVIKKKKCVRGDSVYFPLICLISLDPGVRTLNDRPPIVSPNDLIVKRLSLRVSENYY